MRSLAPAHRADIEVEEGWVGMRWKKRRMMATMVFSHASLSVYPQATGHQIGIHWNPMILWISIRFLSRLGRAIALSALHSWAPARRCSCDALAFRRSEASTSISNLWQSLAISGAMQDFSQGQIGIAMCSEIRLRFRLIVWSLTPHPPIPAIPRFHVQPLRMDWLQQVFAIPQQLGNCESIWQKARGKDVI
jgi:hypothetical protein